MIPFHLEVTKLLSELESFSPLYIRETSGIDMWGYDKEALQDDLAYNLQQYNFSYPPSCVGLFLMPSEVELSWVYDEENIAGRFKLRNVKESIIQKKSNIKGYNEVFDEREVPIKTRELFRKSRYIDYIENYGYTCIMKEDDNTWDLNSIWFMEEVELTFRKLDLDLETYFKTVLTVKGANFWQFLFYDIVAKENYIDRYYMEHICRWVVKLPELFPNHDYSEVMKRYKFIAENNPNERDIFSTNEKLMALGLW